ncbi:MAG: DsbE family thiol:disulfide interchange protein [Alphaproteobacteria bacterium HGW-Alphaproteobacteria-2]|nr:MAG: DsbE family thiol:disulfide interchange protein [Alphaproteobacteria bacterium HGW-Alphaproteobacteria-2]
MAARRIPPLVFLPPLLFAALAALFLLGLGRDKDTLPSTLIGQFAPALPVAALGGKPALDDAMLRAPGVKLVNFWASWCGPCRVEHPTLTALAAEGVTIYGVNYKDSAANALTFLGELGDPYRAIGTDENGRIAIEWGVYGIPETFVIDGAGRIVLRFAGPVTRRVLEETIRPAMAQAAAGS